jgi:hypothetical protein
MGAGSAGPELRAAELPRLSTKLVTLSFIDMLKGFEQPLFFFRCHT